MEKTKLKLRNDVCTKFKNKALKIGYISFSLRHLEKVCLIRFELFRLARSSQPISAIYSSINQRRLVSTSPYL